MKNGQTFFLRGVIYLIGGLILSALGLGIPYVIVSNDVGGYLPILLGMYLPAVPFFFGLYQGLKLLDYVDANTAFSDKSVSALWTIKYCAAVISVFYAFFMPYIYLIAEADDAPGAIVIGLVFTIAPLIVSVFAAVLEKLLKSALAMKEENDLTV